VAAAELTTALEERRRAEEQAREQLESIQADLDLRALGEAQARAQLADVKDELERLRSGQGSATEAPSAPALVGDLTEAVRRLRERVPEPPPVEESAADLPAAEEPVAEAPAPPVPPIEEPVAEPPVPPAPPVEEPVAEAPVVPLAPPVEEPVPVPAPEPVPAPGPEPEPELEPPAEEPPPAAAQASEPGPELQEPRAPEGRLSSRDVAPQRGATAWLSEAIGRMARAGDATRAGRLIVELLPAQRLRSSRGLRYLLQVDELAPLLVSIAEDGVETTAVEGTGRQDFDDLDFSLSGPAAVLAPLAAGSAGRRLAGVDVGGRRRRLRRLLKAMRPPVTLEELAEAQLTLSPDLVLAALVRAIDPAWTAGHSFDVAYLVAGPDATEVQRVQVRDGEPLAVRAGDDEAAATVMTTRHGLIAMLAGRPEPPGGGIEMTGNSNALALLAQWIERAQGRAGADG
jgi:hypothetical protein